MTLPSSPFRKPYWWNVKENSSAAKAMKKAEELYQIIQMGLEKLKPNRKKFGGMGSTTVKETIESEPKLVESKKEVEVEEEIDEEEKERHQQLQRAVSITLEEIGDDPPSTSSAETIDMVSAIEELTINDQSTGDNHFNQTTNKPSEVQAIPTLSPAPLPPVPPSDSTSSTETDMKIISFQSVFGKIEDEPAITNWAGEFKGYLKINFAYFFFFILFLF